MSDCPRFGKWIGGCKFEPRFNKSAPDWSAFESINRMTGEFAERLRTVTYVQDVCVRCGRTTSKRGDVDEHA